MKVIFDSLGSPVSTTLLGPPVSMTWEASMSCVPRAGETVVMGNMDLPKRFTVIDVIWIFEDEAYARIILREETS